jgi:hypothetical protein
MSSTLSSLVEIALETYELVGIAVFEFWNPYLVAGDVLILWSLLVWGLHVEDTKLQAVFDALGSVAGSLLILVVAAVGLGLWIGFLFRTLEIHTMGGFWYGTNPFRLLPTVVPVMLAGGCAGLATEVLTGPIDG